MLGAKIASPNIYPFIVFFEDSMIYLGSVVFFVS